MKVITQQFKLKRLVLITGLVFGIAACNQDDLEPPPPPPRINSAPVIISEAVTTANESQPYTYAVTATDPDAEELTYSVSESSWLTIDAATGRLSGIPSLTDVGENAVSLTASDGTDSVTQEFTIDVKALPLENLAPKFTTTPSLTGAVDEAYSYTAMADDANFDTLIFSEVSVPAWATFDADTATLSGTPVDSGNYPVEIMVSDGTLTASQIFTIAVADPIITPVLVIFENEALPEWAAWISEGGTTEIVTVDGDPDRDQATKFTLTEASVAGFTARDSAGAVGGMPFDASDIADTGEIRFELMLLEETTVPVSSWFFKVEAGSNVNAREVALSSSKEGHSRPVLNTWQSYTFPLATLASGSTLDLSAMDLFIVFPNFADAAGASYLVDNFKIVNVDNSGGVGDGNGPELLINGGFEGGAEAWTLPGTDNVATEDGNSFFEVDVTSAGDAFAVNLSQGMTLIPDTAYVVSFKAKASVARTMLAGLGLYAQPFHSAAETVPLTTEWQTFTYTISTLNDNDGAPFGDDISRVLFDMGAEVGMVSIDDVSVKLLDAE